MNHQEILRHYGIRAQKSLWQNFLTDDKTLETIADSIEITDKDILEIGPGYGALTEKILERKPRSLTIVELDTKMVGVLKSRIERRDLVIPEEMVFTIVEGDVLKYVPDFSCKDTPRRVSDDYSVIANIPYYITSPILFRFLHELEKKPEEMVILMQKEVGEKILGGKNRRHSSLSLALEFSCETIGKICGVPKEYFIPAPKVDSIVLSFRRKKIYDTTEANKFLKMTSAGFISPRKKLLSNLANTLHIPKEELLRIFEQLGFPETIRAEELDLENWKKLVEKIGK